MSTLNKIPGKSELKTNWDRAVIRWSYSKLSTYESCPKQFYYMYIAKLKPFVEVPAMVRGKKIHNLADDYVLGKIKNLPKELKVYSSEFVMLKAAGGTAEYDMSFTKNLKPCSWNDWSNVWCISKLDSVCRLSTDEAAFIDYKTGKVYDTHHDQSDVYALSMFVHWPKVKDVTGEFWYLDQPHEEPGQWEYNRARDFGTLKKMFSNRVNKMATDKKLNRKPSYKCGYCDFNISRGGPCDSGI